jgi:hypothetical protein
VPLTLNPDSQANIEEIQETNDIPSDAIIGAKWAKAPERRSPSQSCGHLIISFSDPDIANRAILNGIVICNKRVTVQKCKREPLRCLKCHGWNHVAAGCSKQTDICGTCGSGDHRTVNCTNNGTKKCVPCNADGHASWDRNCPTFLQKCAEQNAHNPENSMPFFPSAEPWSWAQNPPPQPIPTIQVPSFLDQALRPQQKQRLRQTQLPFTNSQERGDRRGYAHDVWRGPQQYDSWVNPSLEASGWDDNRGAQPQPPPRTQEPVNESEQPRVTAF